MSDYAGRSAEDWYVTAQCEAQLAEERAATIATLTHRAEVAERELSEVHRGVESVRLHNARVARDAANDAAALWRERCNKAEARVEAMQSSRSLCIEALRGVQATGDVDEQTWDVVADGIRALWARLDTRDEWAEEDGRAIAHREFMAAGWRRLARHYQSCHLAGHACLRETHRAKGEQIAALRRARDDDAAYRSDLMEQCDTLRAQVREAATARDAALANADAVLSTAEALRVERDRMRDYWRSEAEMRGACLVEIDQLRAKLARAEGVVAAARAVAREHDRYLSDEVGSMGHVDEACDALRAALATYEEG